MYESYEIKLPTKISSFTVPINGMNCKIWNSIAGTVGSSFEQLPVSENSASSKQYFHFQHIRSDEKLTTKAVCEIQAQRKCHSLDWYDVDSCPGCRSNVQPVEICRKSLNGKNKSSKYTPAVLPHLNRSRTLTKLKLHISCTRIKSRSLKMAPQY